MYKVFVNDCLIILTENNNILTDLEKVSFKSSNISGIIENLFAGKSAGYCLLCNDLIEDWKYFKSLYKVQKAAGGKVYNKNKEVLFIYRFGKWDLPKGKLEKNETIENCAIREVEEECGISNLTINKSLETTYHIFKRKGKTILKITYWFLMQTNFNGKLVPQMEEGIEEVCFKNDIETKEALKNTYKNIELLFN